MMFMHEYGEQYTANNMGVWHALYMHEVVCDTN